ncbi:reactive intermediate/imine deaminase [Halohasta litchfieldiae]|jgi:reactive intermediate/imine deaminase|uniref:Reactive intermediate/imine deaminase n=1 Tax=Halohasta litchfieldiae TaxID=1073996 RepID=A0A1H6RW43_9EURY|nr:RidA family protein [Halohasta litchfieldiae]ATW89351.1 reactive intermediate/imine deaminase [Halohasta litchfieldiae]SEI59949.1 reactive intermediate/imine deaminase [Halohasta litchfieldiae]
MKRVVDVPENADVLGPYSHGTTNGDLLFTAGQIPITPTGEVLDDEPITVQTEQALSNIEQILVAADLTMAHVLKTTVYMTDIGDFNRMNEVYRSFFDSEPPARTAFEVQRLADGAAIEIEAVATHE